MATLLVAEHAAGRVLPHTLNSITAARKLLGKVTALVTAGREDRPIEEVSKRLAAFEGVDEVLIACSPALEHGRAEPHSALLYQLQNSRNYSHIVGASSSYGKNVLPRAAALLGVQPVSDVVEILDPDTFKRPIYAGNAFVTVKYATAGAPRVLTVRPTAFPAAVAASSGAAVNAVPKELLECVESGAYRSQWAGQDVRASARPELGSAKVVICGGRALKSSDNFKMLEQLADLLGGAVGASRAAVDAGFVPNDLQVGQTGKVVAPDLYIGVGISGAIQHLAGMKDSKTIVAINNDSEAPIFQIADYGLAEDLFKAVPELIEEVKKLKASRGGA